MIEQINAILARHRENPHQKFRDAIRGKSIAIVGTSEHIKDKEQCEIIDNHDLVLRFSTCFNLLPYDLELEKHIGSRNDIFYVIPSFVKEFATSLEQNIKKAYEHDVKFIRQNMTFDKQQKDTVKKIKTKISQLGFNEKMDMHNAVCALNCSEEILKLDLIGEGKQSYKVLPRTGFQAVIDLLIHDVGHINMYGMTYYHGGNNFSRNDSISNLDPCGYHHGGKSNRHDSRLEAKALNLLIRNGYPINTDDVLTKVVEMYD